MSRRGTRVQASQTLFQLKIKETDLAVQEVIESIKDGYSDLDFDFIHWSVTRVKDRQVVLGETIKPHSKGWPIDRLPKSDRIILGMATPEVLHSGTSKEVVVNEVVGSTKQFSSDDHYKFVNGILNNIGG